MAVTINGIHHRNPSGLHAKVKWLIRYSNWDFNKISTVHEKIWKNIVHKSEDNELDADSTRNALVSWEKAVNICHLIIYGKTTYVYKPEKLGNAINKTWFLKLKDYYNIYVKNDSLTKEYFL